MGRISYPRRAAEGKPGVRADLADQAPATYNHRVFWDKLKPKTVEPRAAAVDLSEAGEMVVRWEDGTETRVAFRRLRLECPCASCIDEWTGERRLDPATVPADVKPEAMEPVGNYALRIRWSDGHETGLYGWKQLRSYLAT